MPTPRRTVFDQNRPYCCPVTLPKFDAMDSVVGNKEKRTINVDEGVPEHACHSVNIPRIDVFDHDGPNRRPITFPELPTIDAIAGAKE